MTGLDSAFAPNAVQVNTAKAMGFSWWGFYLPKLPNTDPLNSWTPAQVQLLRTSGVIPVPIVVPEPPHPADPIVLAEQAFAACAPYGLKPSVSVCYNGEHISCTGPVWLPIPDYVGAVGPFSAIQNRNGTLAGLDVDFNINATNFPASAAIACDLEHNASYSSAWYADFQAKIAQLGAVDPPPVKPVDPPPIPKPPAVPLSARLPKNVRAISTSSVNRGIPGWIDVFITGSDGHVYHYWCDNHSWHGYDIVDEEP